MRRWICRGGAGSEIASTGAVQTAASAQCIAARTHACTRRWRRASMNEMVGVGAGNASRRQTRSRLRWHHPRRATQPQASGLTQILRGSRFAVFNEKRDGDGPARKIRRACSRSKRMRWRSLTRAAPFRGRRAAPWSSPQNRPARGGAASPANTALLPRSAARRAQQVDAARSVPTHLAELARSAGVCLRGGHAEGAAGDGGVQYPARAEDRPRWVLWR